MYIPRHHTEQKKKSFFNYKILFLLILISSCIILFLYRHKINRLFYSNRLVKITNLNEEISEKIVTNQVNIQLLNKYSSMSVAFVESNPRNSIAYYMLAKSFYYKSIFEGLKFNTTNLIIFLTKKNNAITKNSNKFKKILKNMYKNALKARAFNKKFEYSITNEFMIYLYQVLNNRRDAKYINEDLKNINYIHLNSDFISLYIWVGILNSTRAGDLGALNKFFKINDKVKKEFKIQLNPRDISFLKGMIFYQLNDYIKALKYFRNSKSELDLITIESIKKEAEIFYMQNLPQKSIRVLEDLYEETGKNDVEILQRINRILQNRVHVHTKLKKEIENLNRVDE